MQSWFSSLIVLSFALVPAARAADAGGDEFFEKSVRPLLVAQCLKCHGNEKPRGKLVMTSRAALLKGGETGPAIVPGKPDKSLLIQALRYLDEPRMPPEKKLSDADIKILSRWVEIGAPWPGGDAVPTPADKPFTITRAQRDLWSIQPVLAVVPPSVGANAWARNPIDRFILARLERARMRPSTQATARTLIRRVVFDLTGLPPTPEEVEAFAADTRPDAYERLVDRLLASPAYGQRWGRHWLDLVRYTDSFDARGVGGETDCADAWRYRDWVVENLNADLGYDRFIMDQIAGDCLPKAGRARRDGIIATGMLALGNWGGGDADKEKLLTDIADDQVDVVTRTFLGLTVSCARCHDHKFDPISTADYYGLAGIFFSSHILPNVGPKTNGPPMMRIPLATPEEQAASRKREARIATLDKELQSARRTAYQAHARARLADAPAYLIAAYDVLYPVGAARPGVKAVAERDRLDADTLTRWIALMGQDESRPLDRLTRDAFGRSGVHAWSGAADCPNVHINTTSSKQTLLTFELPPKSIAVHPGPKSAVVLSWTSPVRGQVTVAGTLRDADPTCGDGVLWRLEHRWANSSTSLGSGKIPNGGTGKLDLPKAPTVTVDEGDRIDLVVLPGAGYECDTTVVDLTIRHDDSKQKWSPTTDLVADPFRKAKQPWSLLDTMTLTSRVADPALTAWVAVMARVKAGKADRAHLQEAAKAFSQATKLTDEKSPFWLRSPAEEKALDAPVRTNLARLEAELTAARKEPMVAAEFTNGTLEGGVPGSPHAGTHDVKIHVRGRYDRLGELVPRRFPEVLAGTKQTPIREGSGRAELARWIANRDNPLTARVMVNRLWMQHFGRGLVNTPSNFGLLGEKPTHPELLDWLAAEMVRCGWSLKDMHRLMVTSATYRQENGDESVKADPENLLLGRMPRRRLEAEAIRDALLSVAGRLDVRPGGLATRDFAQPRRSLYLMTIRSERSGFGPLFDVADSTASVDRRTVSTVAPQALFLLNNAFVQARAADLADQLLAKIGSDAERVEHAYRLLYARPPRDAERRLATAYLAGGSTRDAWVEYAQVLLCANEFIYVD